MKYILGSLFIFLVAIAFGDIIKLKNGIEITGDITSVGKDSITIKTATTVLTIPAADIEKVEMVPLGKKEIGEPGVPKAIKQVGYGCLGGTVGGSCAGIIALWTEGFGDEKLTATIILGAVIVGILAGASIGGGP